MPRSRIARFLLAATLLGLACARPDPFDEAFIRKDLDRRSPQDLYDAAEKLEFHPAPHARLAERQIADFLRTMKLAGRIREIAAKDFDRQAERAAKEESRFARMGDAFAAYGTARSWATAELRAALNLGFNPREQQWVQSRIFAASALMQRAHAFDRDIAQAQANLDIETDSEVIRRKQAIYDDTVAAKQRWEDSQDPDAIADLQIVERHLDALREIFPQLPAG